jgi:hypothetical protein
MTLRKKHRLRVFEIRVRRIILEPKKISNKRREKLCNEELHNLYFSPNIIRIIKSRKIKWPGHVARMERKRNAYGILVGKQEGKRPQDLDVNASIILKWSTGSIHLAQDRD